MLPPPGHHIGVTFSLRSSDSHTAVLETLLSLAAWDQDSPPPHSAMLPTAFIFRVPNSFCVGEAKQTRPLSDFPWMQLVIPTVTLWLKVFSPGGAFLPCLQLFRTI